MKLMNEYIKIDMDKELDVLIDCKDVDGNDIELSEHHFVLKKYTHQHQNAVINMGDLHTQAGLIMGSLISNISETIMEGVREKTNNKLPEVINSDIPDNATSRENVLSEINTVAHSIKAANLTNKLLAEFNKIIKDVVFCESTKTLINDTQYKTMSIEDKILLANSYLFFFIKT